MMASASKQTEGAALAKMNSTRVHAPLCLHIARAPCLRKTAPTAHHDVLLDREACDACRPPFGTSKLAGIGANGAPLGGRQIQSFRRHSSSKRNDSREPESLKLQSEESLKITLRHYTHNTVCV